MGEHIVVYSSDTDSPQDQVGTAFHVATDARHRATIVAHDPRESEEHDNREVREILCAVHIRVSDIADKFFLI